MSGDARNYGGGGWDDGNNGAVHDDGFGDGFPPAGDAGGNDGACFNCGEQG